MTHRNFGLHGKGGATVNADLRVREEWLDDEFADPMVLVRYLRRQKLCALVRDIACGLALAGAMLAVLVVAMVTL